MNKGKRISDWPKDKNMRPFNGILLLFMVILLSGCGDTVNDPVRLSTQQELSQLAKDRHFSVKLFYEGVAKDAGKDAHVFAEVTISKFFPGRNINLFYLPVDQITLSTDLGEFGGEAHLKLTHLFYYHHDGGAFHLYNGTSRQYGKLLETVKADFEEQYSLAEERCMDAQHAAMQEHDDVGKVDYAASTCFYAQNFIASKVFTFKLNTDLDGFPASDRGKALHKFHTHQGRLLLREGDIEGAKEQLLLSMKVTPDATMRSFGPNMSLARDLRDAGEREVVITYLDGCSRFWKDTSIEQWKAEIDQGQTPEFGANLHY